MPIYEYRCKNCGNTFEYLVGIGRGDDDIICKNCGSREMEKLLSTANFAKGEHMGFSQGGNTCCGREERCDNPPCSTGGGCMR